MWEDSRNGNYDIYGYDLETEKEVQVNTNTYDQWNPAVYEDCVIWVDSRYENKDIFGHYRSAAHGVRITTNGGNQANPAIYTDMVWQDSRNGNYHIYVRPFSDFGGLLPRWCQDHLCSRISP